MSNYLKGKPAALAEFKSQYGAYPLWKLFQFGEKTCIQANVVNSNPDESLRSFEMGILTLPKDKVYRLLMYKNKDHLKKKVFINPDYEFCFITEEVQPVAGVPVPPAPPGAAPGVPINPYYVNPAQHIGLTDHVNLIGAKAKAESDNQYLMNVLSDKEKTIATLERENKELNELVDELEAELEELEKDAEEKEKEEENAEAIKGTERSGLEEAVASVIKTHGGTLIENMFDKGVKGAPNFDDTVKEEEKDGKVVNGLPGTLGTALDSLNDRMIKINPKWLKHLEKMVLIGEQKPNTFKMFMARLEAY